MLRNYLKVALRGIVRNKLFTAINIISLAISMSVGLIIIAMILDLLKYDTFHEKRNSIFRVTSSIRYLNYSPNDFASTTDAIAEKLSLYQEIETVVRIRSRLTGNVETELKQLPLSGYFVDNSFFEVFTFSSHKGQVTNSLLDPYSVVLTKSSAEKLYGQENPLGKILRIGKLGDFKITAVMEDVPKFSHLQFELLVSYSTIASLETKGLISPSLDDWSSLYQTYVYGLASSGIPFSIVPEINKNTRSFYPEGSPLKATFDFQPLNNIVPGPDMSYSIGPKMMYLPIIILSGLSLAILFSACFNYTNLSVARAIQRAREFGLRKISGGTKKQIFTQFISETIIISLCALIFSILIFQLVKPEFLAIVPRAEILTLNLSAGLLVAFFGFAVFAGILAGFLPAVYFAKIKPIDALQGSGNLKLLNKINLRKVLISAQFVLTLIFLTGVIIISKQYRFSMNYELGFQRANLINIRIGTTESDRILTEFSKIPEINRISFSSVIPGSGSVKNTWSMVSNGDSIETAFMEADQNFIQNLKLKLVAGHLPQNELQIIVNEKMVTAGGFKNVGEIIGKGMIEKGNEYKIVGVMKDWHYMHLEEPIEPFFIRDNPKAYRFAIISISTKDVEQTLEKMKTGWGKISTSTFSYNFYEDEIEAEYQFLTDFMKIFGFLGAIAMTISLLGMLGMAVYNTEIKLKEIGIRKTLGASGWSISILFSKGFVKLIVIASFIALPLTYVLFDKVILALNFYRTQISVLDLLLSFFIILIISLFTIGFQTIKAARLNPAETLRHE